MTAVGAAVSAAGERTGGEAETAPTAAGALPARHRQPPRDLVRTVACPTCQAAAGTPCEGRRGPRKSHHLARVELLVELRFGQRLELPRTSLPDGGSGAGVKARSADPEGVDTGEADARLREVLGCDAR